MCVCVCVWLHKLKILLLKVSGNHVIFRQSNEIKNSPPNHVYTNIYICVCVCVYLFVI